jgi:hypothetical protein
MKSVTALLTLAFVLTGCVSTRTTSIGADSGNALHGKSLALSHRAKQDFSAATPAKAAFAVIGAFAMIAAGNQLVADNAIEDPDGYIGEQLGLALQNKYGLSAAAEVTTLADTMDIQKLAALYPGADYLLDTQTVNWSILYRMNLIRYRVLYAVKVRLIDVHKAKVLAEGFCHRNDEDDPNPPTYDELTANKAELLKSRLRSDADACILELQQKLLGTQL